MGRVQQDALAAAERFRLAEGKILPALTAALQAESAATAYAAGQVLAALASGAARQMAIVQALAAAVRDPANLGRSMCWQVGRSDTRANRMNCSTRCWCRWREREEGRGSDERTRRLI